MQLQQQESFTIQGPQLEVLGELESKLPAPARRAPVGAMVLAVLALVSVFGIGGARLKGKYDRVLSAYTTSTNEYGDGIQTDLAAQADAAASLIRLSSRILGADDPSVAQANEALDIWNATPVEPAVQYAVNQTLYAAVGDTYNAAVLKGDSDQKTQLDGLYSEFTSRQALVERAAANDYNPKAEEYNQITQSLPGSLIGQLWGVGHAQLFAPVDTANG